MPELSFKGKEFVHNHHLTVPHRPLVPDPAKGIGPARLDGNLIIQGDNLHALKSLLPLYAGSHHFAPGVWALLPLLGLQGLLSFLLAYLLAILAAALRDVVQVVGVLLSLGVFLSPVLFPVTMFPAGWRWLLWLNPMTAPILGYQSALLQGAWPAWPVWAVLLAWIGVLAALLSLAIGRGRDQLVDWL